jgi:tetratricopeptide (TPR) repeat protein
MEILNRIIAVSIIIVFCIFEVTGQDSQKKMVAFRASYEREAAKDYQGAVKVLRDVYDEKSYEINLRLGWLTYMSGNHTESINYYKRALSLMPYAVEPRLGIVNPLLAMGNISEAESQLSKVLEITPNYSVAIFRLGLIYYNRGDYDLARKNFEKVVNLWPFDYDALTMLGWAYYRLNNVREAQVLFEKALLNSPDGESAQEGLNLLKK